MRMFQYVVLNELLQLISLMSPLKIQGFTCGPYLILMDSAAVVGFLLCRDQAASSIYKRMSWMLWCMPLIPVIWVPEAGESHLRSASATK